MFINSANTQSNDYHNGIVLPRTNWVYACAAVPASGTVRVFVNGQDRSGAQDFSTAGAPGQLGVNLGGYAGEGSNFGIAALITWNSALSLTELAAASTLLATSYSLQSGICAPPSPPPPPPPSSPLPPPPPPLPLSPPAVSQGCVNAPHRFRPASTDASTVLDLGSATKWAATPVGLSIRDVSGSAGLPGWAGPYAYAMDGSNYIDFGTQTFGGTFSIATLARKAAVPAGNNPVFDFASSSDGVQLYFQSSGQGPVFSFYDGRMYQTTLSDTTSVANGVWTHVAMVFEVTSNASACAAAGASRASCTIVSLYKNGQLLTTLVPYSASEGFTGRNPVVKGLIGNIYEPVTTVQRSGLYISRSNWPQSGFNGDIADFQFWQDVALSAQNVSDMYSGALQVC
jgi:hypothetical protein